MRGEEVLQELRNSARVIGITAVLLASIAGFAAGEEKKMTRSEIRGDQSPCYSAFQPGARVEKSLCDDCKQFIIENAALHDQVSLFQELSRMQCEEIDYSFPEAYRSGWSFYLDQDVLVIDSLTHLNDDRNYTMGMGVALSGSAFSDCPLARARGAVDGLLTLHTGTSPLEKIHTFDIGVTAFTPNELEEREPIHGDRPYASLLYVSNSKMTAYNSGYTVKSKLVVGVLGLRIAKVVQRGLHMNVGLSSHDPLGWDNQISDGGELTALYSVERTALWLEDRGDRRNWDISYTLAGNVGYYTDISAGIDVRFGLNVVSPYYAHNANPLSTANHVNCATCSGTDNYFFAGYRARLVGYNVLLQGQFRDSKVEFSSSEIRRVLHEGNAGWTYRFNPRWQLTYALNVRSKEYEGIEERAHWFGGLYLTKNFSD